MIKNSFELRVIAVCYLLIALPLLIYSFIFFQRFYNDSIMHSYDNLWESSQYTTYILRKAETISEGFVNELAYVTQLDTEIKKLPNVTFDKKLADLVNIPNQDVDVLITDAGQEGRYTILASDVEGLVGKEFLSYTRLGVVAEKGKGGFIRFVFSEKLNKIVPYMFASKAIVEPKTEKILGFLLVRNKIEQSIQEILEPYILEGQKLSYAIVQNDGIIQDATDPTLAGHTFQAIPQAREAELMEEMNYPLGRPFVKPPPIAIKKADPTSSYFEFEWQGEIQLAAKTEAPDIGYSMVVYTPKKPVFRAAIHRFSLIYTVFGLILLLGAGIAFGLTRWVSSPFADLLHLMRKVREGKFEARFKPKPWGFEINYLGTIFNQTLSNLLENMQIAENERVKKETYKKEIEIAEKVQKAILPATLPKLAGVEIEALYIPAKEVGGDFHDAYAKGEKLFFFCGDAAGLGISTCLYSLGVRSSLRAYSTLYDNVGEVLAQANNAFCEDTGDSGMFMSVAMASFDKPTGTLNYYACGHVPGIIRKKDGRVSLLKHSGMALGLLKAERYTPLTATLEPGDVVIFHTDGLNEATNERHQHFSEQRVINVLQQKNWETARQIVEGLREEVLLFTRHTHIIEDISIIAMKIM